MNLSPHFTLEEMYYSPTAIRRGIDNYPSQDVIDNLKILCQTILEPIRTLVAGPVDITSGYRSVKLNKAVGGSQTPPSAHIQGRAADIECDGMTIEELYQKIKASDIPFDKNILEFPPNGWVHVQWRDRPRRECYIATKNSQKKTIYTPD